MKQIKISELKQGDKFAFNIKLKGRKYYIVERVVNGVVYCKDDMALNSIFGLEYANRFVLHLGKVEPEREAI